MKFVATQDDEDDEGQDPQELVDSLNATVTLLGQAIHKLAYEQRIMVLGAFSDIRTAKK